jgi:hypothetical protein
MKFTYPEFVAIVDDEEENQDSDNSDDNNNDNDDEIERIDNIFAAVGEPSIGVYNYAQFRAFFIKAHDDYFGEGRYYHKSNLKNLSKKELNDYHKTVERINKSKQQIDKKVTNYQNIKKICVNIEYPLTNEAYIEFILNEGIEVTYGFILYAYTIAYQLVYKIEEEIDDKNPGNISSKMLNRARSNGRYGIWGHAITDLCYNGYSSIWIHSNYVRCGFDCDSLIIIN